MTAVARRLAGSRPGAGALKHATIGWAIANGLEVLETGNDTDNAADARGQPPARLPAAPDRLADARTAVRRHHGRRRPTPRRAPATLPPRSAMAYDSPRASMARARASTAPYIAGGERPGPGAGPARERTTGGCWSSMVVPSSWPASCSASRSSSATGSALGDVLAAPSERLDGRLAQRGRARRDAARADPHPSVNPPSGDAPDAELEAARYIAGVLTAAGLEPRGPRTGARPRLGPRPAPRRRDRRRAAAPAVPPRRGARHARPLDATTRSRPTSRTATSTAAAPWT